MAYIDERDLAGATRQEREAERANGGPWTVTAAGQTSLSVGTGPTVGGMVVGILEELKQLDEALMELARRLEPLLGPPRPELVGGDGEKKAKSENSPIVEELAGIARAISDKRGQVRRFMDRLEV